MYKKNNWLSYFFQELVDIIIISIFFFVFQKLQYLYFYPKDQTPLEVLPTYKELFINHYKALLLIIISWIFIADNNKLYEFSLQKKLINNCRKLTVHILVISIIIFAISGLKDYDLFDWKIGVSYVAVIYLVLIILRVIYFLGNRFLNRRGIGITNILLLDENENTQRFIKLLNERKEIGLNFKFHIPTDSDFRIVDHKLYYKDQLLETILIENQIEQIFVSQMGKFSKEIMVKIYDVCEVNHVNISYIPYSIYNDLTQLNVQYIDTLPILVIKRFPLDLAKNQILKLILDKVFSLFVIVFLLSWLIPIISILVMIDSKGPIFFVQKRNGLNGKVFNCYKFRTMRQSNDNSIKATVRNDNRITYIGKILRKTSLDEIPQFINVFLGDMSIVGPRPHMISQDHYYREVIKKYNLRHYVKPGITGLSQVKGYRGAIDCNEDMENRIRTDIYYVRNWSILLDIQIIYLTIILILKGDENAI